MNKADLEDYLPCFAAEGYGRLGDNWYAFPDDGDLFILYYRKDLFEDPKNQADFKAKYGYELVPPKTWKEFNDIGNFFTDTYAPELYGGAIQRADDLDFYWWTGAFSGNGGQFFNTDTMKPLINSKAGVKTLQEMVDQNKWMPPGVEKWGFMEVLSAWLEGKLAMTITWPPIGRWSAGYGAATEQLSWVPTSKVIGKVGYAPMPGGRPTMGGGWAMGVSSDSKHKDAAYLFVQWMNSPEISLQRVMLPFALRDPFRISHFESPLYRSLWDNADEYLDTLMETGKSAQGLLGIPGAREYSEALEKAITSSFAGTDPKKALDNAAEIWEEITKRLGIEDQKEAYQIWRRSPYMKEGSK
jgi:multiple sugar transport system substrate-binding protein